MSPHPWEVGDHPQRWQGYFDPDTGILRNLVGARSLEQLHIIEDNLVEARTIELLENPVQGTYDLAHIRGIHRQLFQDVYPWAGELRTVNMEKGRPFADVSKIAEYADYLASEIRAADFLKGAGRDEFVDRLADFYNQLNDIHPFREGNGRSQRILWEQLAEGAGKTINWLHVEGMQVDRASERGRAGQLDELRAMFSQIVEDRGNDTPQTRVPETGLGGLEAAMRAQGVPEQAIRARMQAEKIMKRPITGQMTGKDAPSGKTRRDVPGLSHGKGTAKDQSF